jgi:asparagine synthase (glutamine-hydrolysing)
MRVSGTRMRMWRYWRPDHTVQHNLRFNDAVEQLHELAADAVARRMISDVPLGAFLSGGVDSTAAVGFMAAQVPGRVKTFSIGFTDRSLDELRFARMAVDRHSTDHHERVVTPDVLDVLDELVGYYDEPFGDSSAIPMLYLARMTREHVTVALSGDGADEIFGGYRRYAFGVLEHRLREKFPTWFRKSVFRTAGKYYPKFDYLPQIFRAKTLLGNLSRELSDAYFTSMSTFHDEGLQGILSTELKRNLGGYSTSESYRERFRHVQYLAPLSQMQAVDLDTYLPGDILVKADRATMAHSLESRSPWLDYRIAELSYRMPAEYKLYGRVTKRVFRSAVFPYVPKPLLRRRKMGFSVPLGAWFRTSLKPVFERYVLRGDIDQFCSVPEIRRIWNEHLSGLHNHDRKLWNLLMLASWNARHGSGRYTSELATTAG